jgi:hypothetical protein
MCVFVYSVVFLTKLENISTEGRTTLENISTEGETTLENISTEGEIMSKNFREHQYLR